MKTYKRTENITRSCTIISIEKLFSSSCVPRRLFKEDELLRLAASIRQNGLLTPLIVRPRKKCGSYEVISGERRLSAARLAGLTHLNCVILKGISDRRCCEIAFIENNCRAAGDDFADADAIEALISSYDLTCTDAASELGLTLSEVRSRLRFNEFSFEERRYIQESNLSPARALPILRLSGEYDRLCALKHIAEKGLSPAASDDFCRRYAADPLTCRLTITGRKQIDLELSEEYQSKNTKCSVKDTGFFINSIDATLRRIQSSGAEISSIKNDLGGIVEYCIQLQKK